MDYNCLICGYTKLGENPFEQGVVQSTHEICPSCGFHYGYDNLNGGGEYSPDFTEVDIIIVYRKNWITNGMKWWSKDTKYHLQPQNWDPKEQLKNIPKEFLAPGERY